MGGLGLGIDRLIMLLAGDQDPERPGTVVRQPGIRETILFPLMNAGSLSFSFTSRVAYTSP